MYMRYTDKSYLYHIFCIHKAGNIIYLLQDTQNVHNVSKTQIIVCIGFDTKLV